MCIFFVRRKMFVALSIVDFVDFTTELSKNFLLSQVMCYEYTLTRHSLI